MQIFLIRRMCIIRPALLALELTGFAGQQVAVAGALSFQFARRRRAEALGRAAMGLDFRHIQPLTYSFRFSVFRDRLDNNGMIALIVFQT